MEKFLVIVCISLALLIGALLNTIKLCRKEIKYYKIGLEKLSKLFDKVCTTERININKYLNERGEPLE